MPSLHMHARIYAAHEHDFGTEGKYCCFCHKTICFNNEKQRSEMKEWEKMFCEMDEESVGQETWTKERESDLI